MERLKVESSVIRLWCHAINMRYERTRCECVCISCWNSSSLRRQNGFLSHIQSSSSSSSSPSSFNIIQIKAFTVICIWHKHHCQVINHSLAISLRHQLTDIKHQIITLEYFVYLFSSFSSNEFTATEIQIHIKCNSSSARRIVWAQIHNYTQTFRYFLTTTKWDES